jgi:hypothetical protein
MGEVIDLNGDIAEYNVTNLHETAAQLPSATAIAQVDGTPSEKAAFFTERLESASGRLGESIDNLRTFVSLNAEALSHAVQALRETDRMNADSASQATALIDGMVATAPSASGTGTPSSSKSSTLDAFGAR